MARHDALSQWTICVSSKLPHHLVPKPWSTLLPLYTQEHALLHTCSLSLPCEWYNMLPFLDWRLSRTAFGAL